MKIITLEEHFLNLSIAKATNGEVELLAPGMTEAFSPKGGLNNNPRLAEFMFDIGEKRIADMDADGIDMQVLSINPLGIHHLQPEKAIPLIKESNDILAEAIKAHPDRFAGFAALPMSDPEVAAKELERCVKTLGFKGTMLNGCIQERFLDEPEFEPVLKMAAELDVPIYIHPNLINKTVREIYYGNFDPIVTSLLGSSAWGWHVETGIQVLRLILAGVFDKYPNLQVIIGHWGELIPFYLERLDANLPMKATHLKRSFKDYILNNVYVTPSGMFNMPQFTNTLEIMGSDRIMYSVDYPFIENKGARDFIENAPISQEVKEKIAHGNAEKLLKL